MAELIYDETGRLLFTEEMKKEYTILMPQMLPIHFSFLKNIMVDHGYKVELLTTTHKQITLEGLKSVHNDTCYPALLVIGQLMDAIKSGKYDLDKIALIITQTGGGCRASNYIALLRKALKKNGLDHIPVVSFNMNGMEKNPGFAVDAPMIMQLMYAVFYGDLIMHLANQCRPYELEKGATDALIDEWVEIISAEIGSGKFKNRSQVLSNWRKITEAFAALPMDRTVEKTRVGVVGEIYVKYAPLGNNNLEAFLASEDCEVVVPGLVDFVLYSTDSKIIERELFGKKQGYWYSRGLEAFLVNMQKNMIKTVEKYSDFRPPFDFSHTKTQVGEYISRGNKMGEGWLLTGEMIDLIKTGTTNIVCTQPFGCLPNHIVGKGMIRKLRENHPEANIVAIDYDPGATRVNQENRIKLMLANARKSTL